MAESHSQATTMKELGVEKLGPYGREGPETFNFVLDKTDRIKTVRIETGGIVDGIGFDIVDKSGKIQTVRFGGQGHETVEIHMTNTEYITQISGSHGEYGGDGHHRNVGQIYIHTNVQPTGYGPYGRISWSKNVVAFESPVVSAGQIVGFFGRAGTFLQSIGVSIRKDA